MHAQVIRNLSHPEFLFSLTVSKSLSLFVSQSHRSQLISHNLPEACLWHTAHGLSFTQHLFYCLLLTAYCQLTTHNSFLTSHSLLLSFYPAPSNKHPAPIILPSGPSPALHPFVSSPLSGRIPSSPLPMQYLVLPIPCQ